MNHEMNSAQKKLWNLLLDNAAMGVKPLFFTPRRLGKKSLDTFMWRFIHNKGRRFFSAKLPDDIKRGTIGDCFDHCMIQAMYSDGKYFYCEGMAYINKEWIHHAWLTDKHGQAAYDPTWRAVNNKTGEDVPLIMAHYVGAVLDLHYVMEFVARTEYKSPLANYEKDPELAQRIYDTAS